MMVGRIIGIREVIANLLRVMRGGGHTDRILGDIESIAEFTSSTGGDHNLRSKVRSEIASDLRGWRPDDGDQSDANGFEYGVCDAALRIIASRLEGSDTHRARATSDFWRHIWEEIDRQRGSRETIESRHVDRLAAEAQIRHQEVVRFKAANGKVFAAANDNATSYVYFITDGEAIKIGKADKPKSRLSGLQTSHHKPLRILATMPGGLELEVELHRVFAQFRLRGEWFKDCREIRDFIARNGDQPAPKTARKMAS